MTLYYKPSYKVTPEISPEENNFLMSFDPLPIREDLTKLFNRTEINILYKYIIEMTKKKPVIKLRGNLIYQSCKKDYDDDALYSILGVDPNEMKIKINPLLSTILNRVYTDSFNYLIPELTLIQCIDIPHDINYVNYINIRITARLNFMRQKLGLTFPELVLYVAGFNHYIIKNMIDTGDVNE